MEKINVKYSEDTSKKKLKTNKEKTGDKLISSEDFRNTRKKQCRFQYFCCLSGKKITIL